MWGLIVFINRDYFKDYEIDLLSSGACKYLFKLSFIFQNDDVEVIVDNPNYKPLSELNIFDVKDLLRLFERTIEALRNIAAYPFAYEKIELSKDTIFVDDNLNVKLLLKYEDEMNIVKAFDSIFDELDAGLSNLRKMVLETSNLDEILKEACNLRRTYSSNNWER